ncbi:2-hydroxyacid dehydrogenase [Sediminibacillus albus]|uniref:Glyoxylate reductase n=1 Tax=Sediminibacillus albus TaxID=407036 RepID=A0A1G8Z0B7_9BACI|nr:D-glycerate dehydrogenase [Sediminibacillus albus]SDK07755.1 glyoxylate reductase [Sediminibacillus albus]
MAKPYIYITRRLPEKVWKELKRDYEIGMWPSEEEPVDASTLKYEISRADALLTMLTDRIDADLLKNAENLQVIANLAVGYDNIDIEAAKAKGITVTNTPDVLTETTADLTFSLLMATARRIVEANQFIKQGGWKNWAPFLLAGSDVHHKTIGIVGMGRIGAAVARRAKGFSMDIVYHNRSRRMEVEKDLGARYLEFDELLKTADFVVCLAPLTTNTKYMFNKESFAQMKSTAIFINASRGKNVDENALFEALANEQIAAAGLDVFEIEPIDNNHPLLTLSQVTCLPHIGSATMETREQMIELCLENIKLVLNHRRPLTPVS